MDYAAHYESHWYIFSSFGRNTWNYDDVTDCCLGLMTKKQKVPHKNVWMTRKVPHKSVLIVQKVPHKNVIDFAILSFFSLLQQEYNNNTMNI